MKNKNKVLHFLCAHLHEDDTKVVPEFVSKLTQKRMFQLVKRRQIVECVHVGWVRRAQLMESSMKHHYIIKVVQQGFADLANIKIYRPKLSITIHVLQ